jgi:hypothetical protein
MKQQNEYFLYPLSVVSEFIAVPVRRARLSAYQPAEGRHLHWCVLGS